MGSKTGVILQVCLPILLFFSTMEAVQTDTAGIYNPVLPHRQISKSPCYPYPYYSDYDLRGSYQVPRQPNPPRSNLGVSQIAQNRDSSTSAENNQSTAPPPPPPPPSKPNPIRYPHPYQYQPPSASSGFHAVNQVEFIDPLASANLQPGRRPGPQRRPVRPRRPRPRPTCTIMGPGGGGGGMGSAGS